MKVYIFEYATCFNIREFLLEGKLMLETLVEDFKKLGFDVYSSIYKKIKLKHVKNIEITNLNDLYKIRSYDFEYLIFIAPNRELLEIAKMFKNDDHVLLSDYKNLEFVLDKIYFYHKLKDKFNVPEIIKNEENLSYPIVIKHRYGTGCEDLFFVRSREEYLKIKKQINEDYILQEYVDGVPASIIVFADDNNVIPICLNLQIISYSLKPKYLGGIVNVDHKLKEKIYEEVKKLVRFLKLKFLVGIDLVIGKDSFYFIEVNPRITTSMCFLKYISNINLAEVLILSKNSRLDKLSFKIEGKIFFLKIFDRFIKFLL